MEEVMTAEPGGGGVDTGNSCAGIAQKSWDLEKGPVPGIWNHGNEFLKPLPKMPRKQVLGVEVPWLQPSGSRPVLPIVPG